MKNILSVLLLLPFFGAAQIHVDERAKDTLINDTLFFERTLYGGAYHAVFVETNRHSEFHRQLRDFSFDNLDQQVIELELERIHGAGQRILHTNPKGLPSEWLPLHRYKGNYYLYAPSDWGTAGRMITSDSLFIDRSSMDGPMLIPMKKIERTGDTWHVSYADFIGMEMEGFQAAQLYIHLIDPEKGIAVWEYRHANESFYRLYVAAGKADQFDAIVNYCRTDKWGEFETDEIDYPSLLLQPK